MSRTGKKPIPLPKGVKIKVNSSLVEVEGPRGKLSLDLHPTVELDIGAEVVTVKKKEENKLHDRYWGMSRMLVANMIIGVTEGFKKVLEVIGVGYKAQLKGKDLELVVGYSHTVLYPAPDGISFKIEPGNRIIIEGASKEQVGQVAAEIRKVKKPEPYKGKGIKYENEIIRRKAGKAAI